MRTSVIDRTSVNRTKLDTLRKGAFSSNEALFNHFNMQPTEVNGDKMELKTLDEDIMGCK